MRPCDTSRGVRYRLIGLPPPDLVIQDELHFLISRSAGHDGRGSTRRHWMSCRRFKLMASMFGEDQSHQTATVRRALSQIRPCQSSGRGRVPTTRSGLAIRLCTHSSTSERQRSQVRLHRGSGAQPRSSCCGCIWLCWRHRKKHTRMRRRRPIPTRADPYYDSAGLLQQFAGTAAARRADRGRSADNSLTAAASQACREMEGSVQGPDDRVRASGTNQSGKYGQGFRGKTTGSNNSSKNKDARRCWRIATNIDLSRFGYHPACLMFCSGQPRRAVSTSSDQRRRSEG